MKEGIPIERMVLKVQELNEQKKDYLCSTGSIHAEHYNDDVFIHLLEKDKKTDLVEPLTISQTAVRQIGAHLNIPGTYMDRMRSEAPGLMATTINEWLSLSEPIQRLLRTYSHEALLRAFLSNRYRRIDNIDILTTVLPILEKIPDAQFVSSQITENKMYIKVVNPRLQAEVEKGDIVQAGIIISNSEIGSGSLTVQPLMYRLICLNGTVVNDASIRKIHLGRANESDENLIMYRDETKIAEDKAFLMKIEDTVNSVIDEVVFKKIVQRMKDANQIHVTAPISDFVELASKDIKLSKEESKGVLQRFIEGRNYSKYGLHNAITRYSQDVQSYDRATELEEIGGEVLSMPNRKWKNLNLAAENMSIDKAA